MKYIACSLLLMLSLACSAQSVNVKQISTTASSCTCEVSISNQLESCSTDSGYVSIPDYVKRVCAENYTAHVVKKDYIIASNGNIKFIILEYVVDNPARCIPRNLFTGSCD